MCLSVNNVRHGAKGLPQNLKPRKFILNTHKRKCHFFPTNYSRGPDHRTQGPGVERHDSCGLLLRQVLLRYLVFQPSPLTYPIYFFINAIFSTTGTFRTTLYVQKPFQGICDCFKALSAGDGSSVVVEQSNFLQAYRFQSPILQTGQCIQDQGASSEPGWVCLGFPPCN